VTLTIEIIKAIASIGALVTAFLAWMSTRAVGRQALALRQQSATEHAEAMKKVSVVQEITDATAAKTDGLVEKTIEIHTATNGHLSELRLDLAKMQGELRDQKSTATAEIAGLKALIANMVEAKADAKLAEARADLKPKP
jgi:hypothetical protein